MEQHATVYGGGKPKEVPIPEEMRGEEEARREALVEAAAEASDELMTRYLDRETLSDAEIEAGGHQGKRAGAPGTLHGSRRAAPGSRPMASGLSRTRRVRWWPRSSRRPPTHSLADSPTCASSQAPCARRRTSGTPRDGRKSASGTCSACSARSRSSCRRRGLATSSPSTR